MIDSENTLGTIYFIFFLDNKTQMSGDMSIKHLHDSVFSLSQELDLQGKVDFDNQDIDYLESWLKTLNRYKEFKNEITSRCKSKQTIYNIGNVKDFVNYSGMLLNVKRSLHEHYDDFPKLEEYHHAFEVSEKEIYNFKESISTTAYIIDVDYEYVNGDLNILIYTRDVGSSTTNLVLFKYYDYFYIELTENLSFEKVQKAVNGYCSYISSKLIPWECEKYTENRFTGKWNDINRREIPNSAPCNNKFYDARRHVVGLNSSSPLVLNMELVEDCKSLYGYQAHTQRFVKITTANPSITKYLFDGLSKKYTGKMIMGRYGSEYYPEMHFFEANISIVNKFLTQYGISGCIAIDIYGKEVKNTLSTCDRAIECSFFKRNDSVAFYEPKVMYYDIECLSLDVNVFPSADTCPCIQISYLLMDGNKKIDNGVICFKETPGYAWYETEEQMLLRFSQIVNEFNPDAITGFNSNAFDMPYIIDRMKVLGIYEIGGMLSRRKNFYTNYKRTKKESKQFGAKETTSYVMPGRIMMDQFEIIKGDPTKKMRSYKLKDICAKYLGDDNKEDLAYKEIPSLFKTVEGRQRIASYCLQDTMLLYKIDQKTMLGITTWGMTKVLGVTPDITLNRGLVFKLMCKIKQYTEKYKFLIPSFTKAQKPVFPGKYQGAFVLDPDIGYYEDPVVVLDFASLYPALMIGWNLCYSTIVFDKKWMDENPDKYEVHCGVPFVKHSTHKGIVPMLEEEMARQRKIAKKKMADASVPVTQKNRRIKELKKLIDLDKNEFTDKELDEMPTLEVLPEERVIEIQRLSAELTEDKVKVDIFDSEQLANKIIMNSLYGMLGSPTATVPCVEIAKTITGLGRENLLAAKNYVEQNYCDITGEESKCKVIYGDSVLPSTPLFVKINNILHVLNPEQLSAQFGVGPWRIMYNDSEKEAMELPENSWAWTDIGWTRLYRVIRHNCGKDMLTVSTPQGIVTCTIDHSLTTNKMQKITPKDCIVGKTQLLHNPVRIDTEELNVDSIFYVPMSSYTQISVMTNEFAKFVGLCHMNGSVNELIDNAFMINNNGKIMKEEEINSLNRQLNGVTLKISSDQEMIHVSTCAEFFDWFFYKFICYSDTLENKIPSAILSGTLEMKKNYLYGLTGVSKLLKKYIFEVNGKCFSHSVFVLLSMIGFDNISVNAMQHNFYLIETHYAKLVNADTVNKIEHYRHTGYVYDLTTDVHRFQCGIGNIIGLNTDSIFIKMPNIPVIRAIEYGKKLDKRVQQDVFIHRPPMRMEYEKTYYPYIITRRKGYCGAKYEDNDTDFKVAAMGFQVVRRDAAHLCTKTMKAYFDYIFSERDKNKALKSIKVIMSDLMGSVLTLEDFVITKKIAKAHYKTEPPHVTSWKRMIARVGKAEAPAIGERFEFIVTKMNPKMGIKLPQAIMDVDLVKEKGFENVQVDIDYYYNTFILKPMEKIMNLIHGPENTRKVLDKRSYELKQVVTQNKNNLLGFLGKQKITTKKRYHEFDVEESFIHEVRNRLNDKKDEKWEAMECGESEEEDNVET